MPGITYNLLSGTLYNTLSDRWMQYLRNWHVCCCLLSPMKSSLKLLLVVTAAITFSVAQPAKAERVVQAGPTISSVPDRGSTMSLLGLALLGVAALRRKLSR
jgi:VPDSG-CTERM motif